MNLYLFLKELRPAQWSKNLLVFAALIFTVPHVTLAMTWNAVQCFVMFCLVSGCVYIVNDYADLESDRQNAEKAHRPMASGALRPTFAFALGCVVFVAVLAWSCLVNPWLTALLTGYFLLNVAYSLYLKHIALVDIFSIAAGFVMRAVAGGLSISVELTSWFLFCSLLLSLFLATSKRKYELMVAEAQNKIHRKVLRQYSMELVNQLNVVIAATLIMSYSMFTFTSGHTHYLMFSIPFVIFGVFRYFQLIQVEGQGGKPEVILFRDKQILATVILYSVLVVTLLWVYN